MKKCEKNCEKCKYLNTRTDDAGYPFGYECLKYGNSVFPEDFHSTKDLESGDIIFLSYRNFRKLQELYFKNPDCIPRRLYASQNNSGNWEGADNAYGKIFIEEFADKADCVKWLLDETIYAPELPSYIGVKEEDE